MLVLGFADVMMDIGTRSNLVGLGIINSKVSGTDSSNTSLTAFHLSHLLHEMSTISSRVPGFCCAVF
jgi:hypothetical protein